MTKPSTTFTQIINDHPEYVFVESNVYCWSPATNTISYIPGRTTGDCVISLLHELGHAKRQHTSYSIDSQLVQMELEAWNTAQELCQKYGVSIPQSKVDESLDTYREWQLSRSLCPNCRLAGLQSDQTLDYTCINCARCWSVPENSQCVIQRKVNPAKLAAQI